MFVACGIWCLADVSSVSPPGGGGGTPILKLYGDVPPFRVWFFDRPLINRVSQIERFSKMFYKQGLKITHFDQKMTGIWPENYKQGINFSRFSRTVCHKQSQGFKVRAAPPYPNLG